MNKEEFHELVIPTTEKERLYRDHPEKSLEYYQSQDAKTRWENGVYVFPGPVVGGGARGHGSFSDKANFTPAEVSGIAFNKQTRFSRVPLHRHDYIEMSYVYEGQCTAEINGHRLAMRTGDVCIMDSGVVHTILPTGEKDIVLNCLMDRHYFTASFVERFTASGPIPRFLSNALSEEAIPQSIPVVCVDRYPGVDSSIPRVISEDERGGLLATEHLIACGCHHILFITSAVEDLNKQNRERGYQRALAQHGIPASDTYRLLLPGHRPSMDEAEQLVKAFLAEGRPLDGIFAVSDHAAVGALAALQAAAVDVPGTVKLVGFDDSIYTRIATPSITSVQRFPQKLAHEGCAALLRLIVGEQAPVETVVPVELVERASTVGAR